MERRPPGGSLRVERALFELLPLTVGSGRLAVPVVVVALLDTKVAVFVQVKPLMNSLILRVDTLDVLLLLSLSSCSWWFFRSRLLLRGVLREGRSRRLRLQLVGQLGDVDMEVLPRSIAFLEGRLLSDLVLLVVTTQATAGEVRLPNTLTVLEDRLRGRKLGRFVNIYAPS